MDILHKIYNEKLSDEETYSLLEAERNCEFDGDFMHHLSMNKYEYTAYALGCPLPIIAKWRYEGWPKCDCKTGVDIDYNKFGWKPICIDLSSKKYGLTLF